MSECLLHVVVAQSPAELKGQTARLDWLRKQLATVNTLTKHKVDLFILPELFLTGYNIADSINNVAIDSTDAVFAEISSLTQKYNLAIHFGYPEKKGGKLFNAASCISKIGKLLVTHRKLVLPLGFERDCFALGKDYLTFDIHGFTIGTLICYDAEFPENFRQLECADLVVVPTALTKRWGVVARQMIPTRAFENGMFVCYANHTGIENGMEYYGGSCIVAPNGNELARAENTEKLIFATLNKNMVTQARSNLPYYHDRLSMPIN